MKSLTLLAVAVGLVLSFVAGPLPEAHAATTPLKVAVVVSKKTDAWYAANTDTQGLRRVPGQQYVYSVLSRSDVVGREGWKVTQVDDSVFDSLTTLEQYDCVVLTQVFCLDVQPSKNLQRYVSDGGGLVCMWGSPRVAPQFDTGPSVTWPEHWWNILHGEAGEWGPMSEVYQMKFVDDQFRDSSGHDFPGGWFTTPVWPGTSHPILSGAKTLLQREGYASGDYTLKDPQVTYYGRREGFELATQLAGNRNVTPLLSFKFTNSEALKTYPKTGVVGGYPAACASRYGAGRSAYFYFYLNDFIYYDALGKLTKNSSGVTNRVAATALLESAVKWAGTRDGVTATVRRGGLTWGDIKVYGDAIYGFQYISDDGNISTFGQAEFRVYDPSGKLVLRNRQQGTNVSAAPGQVLRYSNTYKPGGILKSGRYRVEVEYVYNYPWFNTSHKEVVYVTRSQGTGIKTVPTGSSAPVPSTPAIAPNPMTPNGDGLADRSGVGYTIDKQSRVSVRVLSMTGNVLATPVSDVPMSPGPHFAWVNGLTSAGSALPNGMYNVAVDARNTAGNTRRTQLMFVSRFAIPPALGTRPAISNVKTSSVYSSTGAVVPGRVNLSFRMSETGYAVIKVLTYAGEVKTLAMNSKLGAGTHVIQWDGTDYAGRALAAGNYRYYVYITSGGKTPTTALGSGVAALRR